MKLVTFLLLMLVILNSAFAVKQAQQTNNFSGWLVGLNLGYTRLSTPSANTVYFSDGTHSNIQMLPTLKYNGLGGGLYFGYLAQVSKKLLLGGELGYDNNGSSDYTYTSLGFFFFPYFTNIKFSSYDISAEALGRFILSPKYSLQAGLGLANVNQKLTYSTNTPFNIFGPYTVTTSSISQTVPVSSLSVAFKANSQLEVYLKIRHIFGSNLETFKNDKVASMTGLLAGVNYYFA